MNQNTSIRTTSATLFTGALVALVGCTSSEDTGGAGGATSSSTTTSSMMTTTTTTTSSGGGDAPTFGVTKVGDPLWEPVDFHQASVPVGDMFMNFQMVIEGILPPPNHQHHDDLGVGPGAAHAGPYTGEIGAGYLAEGYVDHMTYTKVEGSVPNAVLTSWMMIPSTGASMGSSPDGAMTPIIPNTIFPIAVTIDAYQDNMLLDGYSYGFDVPALDSTLTPPFNVDGHSHFPLFSAVVFDGMPVYPGTIETRIHMEDATGDGYDLVFTAVGTP